MERKFNYKIWVDDIREMPEDYDYHIESVWEFICLECGLEYDDMILIDLDHDAGDYEDMGGDYIQILRYMERMVPDHWVKTHCVFRIHTANPPARQMMLNIIERNEWVYDNQVQ